ncbi:hypothetical protein GCT19_12580 [Paraburkholderia sp. CNPSo 3155]|uniref:Csu type fimbrial protein n=1 Tax=Paraburkholderia atlantica TaxID=2654982 RepID=UPI00128C6D12|nr:spore coat U domain-containing protein [Paraburkholderia atlantica]MPW06473.1 hypothetical protein [Paraburkholderia atlantica]
MPIARALPRKPTALMIWLVVVVALALHAPLAHSQSCYVSGAFGMSFGTVSSSGRAATSAITVNCQPDYSGGQTYYYQVCLYLSSSGVNATFEYGCWVAATDIDFGAVAPPQSQLRENGNIRVQCAPGTSWRVGLDNGLNFDGSMRRMSGPGGFVRYQLYQDASTTQVWGNDDASMVAGTTDVAGNTASLTVYGLVPAQPNLAVGDYIDTIVVTLYY